MASFCASVNNATQHGVDRAFAAASGAQRVVFIADARPLLSISVRIDIVKHGSLK